MSNTESYLGINLIFLRRDAMHSAVSAVARCLSLVRQYCAKMAKHTLEVLVVICLTVLIVTFHRTVTQAIERSVHRPAIDENLCRSKT